MKLKTKSTFIWVKVDDFGNVEKISEDYVLKEGECKIKSKFLTPAESSQLLEDSVHREWDRNQRFERTDFHKIKVLTVQRTWVSWSGFKDEEDNEIACTNENKEIIYNCNKEWVDRVLTGIAKFEKEQSLLKEEERKNSPSSQNGTSEKE
jgi:hypothetical protein